MFTKQCPEKREWLTPVLDVNIPFATMLSMAVFTVAASRTAEAYGTERVLRPPPLVENIISKVRIIFLPSFPTRLSCKLLYLAYNIV